MNRFEDHSTLSAIITQAKYEDKQNGRLYKDNEKMATINTTIKNQLIYTIKQ